MTSRCTDRFADGQSDDWMVVAGKGEEFGGRMYEQIGEGRNGRLGKWTDGQNVETVVIKPSDRARHLNVQSLC